MGYLSTNSTLLPWRQREIWRCWKMARPFCAILLCTLICTFVGVLMFLFSLYINKIIAVAGGLALAIALFPVLNMHPLICYKLARFVPTVWAELARIATVDHTYYWLPSLSYMVVFLLVGITIMTGLIMNKIRYMQFNWENEDI